MGGPGNRWRKLVMTLVKQLKGTIDLCKGGGTEFKIIFASVETKNG